MGDVIRFVNSPLNKGELARKNIKTRKIEYDCAIPKEWIDIVNYRFTAEQLKSFGNIASHFVYVYDNTGVNRTEYLMPLTRIGCKILGILALNI